MLFLKIYSTIVALCCSLKLTQTALFYPSNSAYGIFAAIAVPLDLPHRNVFVSYNFEANYNLPQTWGVPPYATGVEDEDLLEARLNDDNECSNCTEIVSSGEVTGEEYKGTTTSAQSFKNETNANNNRKRRRKRREASSLLTRTHFYHILIDKFQRSGFEGEPCLLRLICETNASELGEVNGVLGNLMHIIFSPTTSKDENLPLAYYQAEVDGIYDQCYYYEKQCSESILDLISTPLHKILEQMQADGFGK